MEKNEISAIIDKADLLSCHYILGHLFFIKFKLLAILNLIPRRLDNIDTPHCAECVYSVMDR